MNIYLAARYSRRLEMVEKAKELEAMGHTVVSRWIDGHHEDCRYQGEFDTPSEVQAGWALEDIDALLRCQILISFTEAPESKNKGRGGRHVEFGFILGLIACLVITDSYHQKPCPILVGPRENVFHHLTHPRQFDTWEEAKVFLAKHS